MLVFLCLMTSALSSQNPSAITGALNFRDIGGLPTADGRVVKRGLLWRSGELSHLSADDIEVLSTLHIRHIYDLRTDLERNAAATAWQGAEIIPISVGFAAKGDPSAGMKEFFANGVSSAAASAAMRAVTAKIAVDGAPEIGSVLRGLAGGGVPAIVHCTAGKDRTGVVTAILLTLLGVPKEAVYEDYLRSNEATPAELARIAANRNKGLPSAMTSMPVDALKVLMSVDRSYLDAAFAAVDQKYGSFGAYTAQGLGLSAADIAALRGLFLENGK